MNLDDPLHPDSTEKYVPPKRDRLAGSHGRIGSPGSRSEANKYGRIFRDATASIERLPFYKEEANNPALGRRIPNSAIVGG
jgi:hypothetical protein